METNTFFPSLQFSVLIYASDSDYTSKKFIPNEGVTRKQMGNFPLSCSPFFLCAPHELLPSSHFPPRRFPHVDLPGNKRSVNFILFYLFLIYTRGGN